MNDTENLKDLVQEKLMTDSESILRENIDIVRDLVKIHEDGSIELTANYSELPPRETILAYYVGARYAQEGGLRETDRLGNSFFYDLLPIKEGSVRKYLMDLRNEGLITQTEHGDNRLVAENLPRILKQLNAQVSNN